MSRRLAGILCLIAISCGLAGCASGFGLFGKSKKSEQWEPEIVDDKPSDWRSEPSKLRSSSSRKSSEDPLDKFIWSSEARDINRSLGGSL